MQLLLKVPKYIENDDESLFVPSKKVLFQGGHGDLGGLSIDLMGALSDLGGLSTTSGSTE
jgi:hypothetical protein